MEKEEIFGYKNKFMLNRIASPSGEADPFLIKVNGYYYLFYTVPDGLKAFKTFDFKEFKPVNEDGYVAKGYKELINAYAPEVYYYNGYFYIVSSPNGNGHYIFRSRSIEGPFEKYTENFHEMIDGSFFIDSDFKKYFLRSGETGIVINEFKDFSSFNEEEKFINSYVSKEAILGRWNEGPHMFKRYGRYYLTFTGTHFLSDAYRVDYLSSKKITSWDDLKYKGTLLISTTKEFYGLGHSMNILGPNLDSYYTCFHNMNDDGVRTFNISRLLFNNEGEMKAHYLSSEFNLKIDRPDFEEFIDSKNYLSEVKTPKEFSIEYNFKGEETRLILGYIDELNYLEFSFFNGVLEGFLIKNGKKERFYERDLLGNIDFNEYHSFRIQYQDGRLALYLDLIELEDKLLIKIPQGKFGFKENSLKNSYLACSKYAFGSSDKGVPFIDYTYGCNYLKDLSKSFKYPFYILEDGEYALLIKEKEEIERKYFLDNEEILKNSGLLGGYHLILTTFLKKGIHEFKLSNIKNLEEIKLIKVKEGLTLNINKFNKDLDLTNFNLYHNYLFEHGGLYFENDRNAYLTKRKVSNYEVSTHLKVLGNGREDSDFVGLAVNVNNYGKVNQFENAFSLNGYLFVINMNHIMIYEANFYHTKLLYKKPIKTREFTLKIKQDNYKIHFYNDNEEIYEIPLLNQKISGSIGILNNHLSGVFYSLNIKTGEKVYEEII